MHDTQRSSLQYLARDAASRLSSSCHGFDHTLRVVALALWIGGHYSQIDHDALEAAAWLHDVGHGYNTEEGLSHAIVSAQVAEEYLPAHGFAPATTRIAVAAIADHRFSVGRQPDSPEGRILQDADRLDALGAIGIARTFAENSRARTLYHIDDPLAEHRALNDDAYVFDHFFRKLLTLRDTLHTPEARHLAERRHQIMERYIRDFTDEVFFTPQDLTVV